MTDVISECLYKVVIFISEMHAMCLQGIVELALMKDSLHSIFGGRERERGGEREIPLPKLSCMRMVKQSVHNKLKLNTMVEFPRPTEYIFICQSIIVQFSFCLFTFYRDCRDFDSFRLFFRFLCYFLLFFLPPSSYLCDFLMTSFQAHRNSSPLFLIPT